MNAENVPRLLVILGPTASGKSRLALHACRELHGEIVNCDSIQMIRGLEIGTAKPSLDERKAVPHHLFDIIDVDQYYSAGRFMSEARAVCREVTGRGRLPVVVGGTGLYLKALLEGVFEGPSRSGRLRQRLGRIADRRGPECLHALLSVKDPGSAQKIAPADRVRLVRALEVFYSTGSPISRLQPSRRPLKGFQVLKFGLLVPRPELYDRIDRRVRQMYDSGLLEEVRRLLAKGHALHSKGFEALGYRHAVAVLRGDLSEEEAVERTQRETRRYAKRQMTWFRKEPGVHWISRPGEDPLALAELLQRLENGI